MDINIQSSVGNVRPDNQDYANYFINQRQLYLAVVCDGMGGHNGGDIASEMAVNHLGYAWENSQLSNASDISDWLNDHIHQENERIYQASLRYPDLKGMGSTLLAAVFLDRQCLVANVGDSRAYLYQEGELFQLTEDDTFVNQLILNGELTEEEGRNHPKKNVLTQSLGVEEELQVKIDSYSFGPNDILLLVSDGLYDGLSFEDMREAMDPELSSEKLAQQLHDQSLSQSGQDNLTILVAQEDEREVED